MVLSGNGGHLSTSMLTKTSPVDIASVVPIGLLDPGQRLQARGRRLQPGAGDHPVGVRPRRSDQLRPARPARAARRDHPGRPPVHDLRPGRHVFAGADPARRTRSRPACPWSSRCSRRLRAQQRWGCSKSTAPASENVGVNGTPRTIGMRAVHAQRRRASTATSSARAPAKRAAPTSTRSSSCCWPATRRRSAPLLSISTRSGPGTEKRREARYGAVTTLRGSLQSTRHASAFSAA